MDDILLRSANTPFLVKVNSKLVALQAIIANIIHVLKKFSELGATASRNIAAGMSVGVDIFLMVVCVGVFLDISTLIFFCHGIISRRRNVVMHDHSFVVCVCFVR